MRDLVVFWLKNNKKTLNVKFKRFWCCL
jgi:hypothetical protein